MRESLILSVSSRLVYHPALVLSLYLLFAGHNQPGGGFVGGLVAGIAVALRFIGGGAAEVRAAFPVRPWVPLGVGLLLAAGTAIAPLLAGQELLESSKMSWSVPILGEVKATTALIFDVGVYLVVVGMILMMFEAFGESGAPDPGSGDEPEPAGQTGPDGRQPR